jgi:2-oxo-4-hydroxy-4-carboxy-5-ureidoimidazoline decarboxylase
LKDTEQALNGRAVDSNLLLLARRIAAAEIRPIDDIRSTVRYRVVVMGNLIVEFLNRLNLALAHAEGSGLKTILASWNTLSIDEAINAILPCCGSRAWAQRVTARRPLADEVALLGTSNEVWRSLPRHDWLEAFRRHPRIGESRAEQSPPAQSVEWSSQEQLDATDADAAAKSALAEANQEYERRFNRIFIVCATGKSAAEILETLRRRLNNDAETELHEAAEQQRQITELRLRKWLQG